MTDRERLYTSKIYIDRLTNGMNPFDGDELPEDTILNDVCLCRAFAFISGLLEQVIQNDGKVSVKQRRPREKFRITESQRNTIEITEEAVGVNAIASRIERVLDVGVKKIPSVTISLWLESEGLLRRVTEDGKTHKEATEEGNALGLFTREVQYGETRYKKTFYDMNAQAYIISNLDAISNFGGQA